MLFESLACVLELPPVARSHPLVEARDTSGNDQTTFNADDSPT